MHIRTEETPVPDGCRSCPYSRCTQSRARATGSTPRLAFGEPGITCGLIEDGKPSGTASHPKRHDGSRCLYKQWMEKPPNL